MFSYSIPLEMPPSPNPLGGSRLPMFVSIPCSNLVALGVSHVAPGVSNVVQTVQNKKYLKVFV